MLDELTAELQEPPATKLSRLRVSVQSTVKPHSPPDEKFLRTWMGRLYTFDRIEADEGAEEETDDDEESSEESSGAKPIMLSAGQDLAFVKVVLFTKQSLDQPEPPHLLYGALRNCQAAVSLGKGQTVQVRKRYFREIVQDLHRTTPIGSFKTRAFYDGWPKGQKDKHRLMFTLDGSPEFWPLFNIRGREKVREIAERIKTLRITEKRKGRVR
jgi:hypothetical protein